MKLETWYLSLMLLRAIRLLCSDFLNSRIAKAFVSEFSNAYRYPSLTGTGRYTCKISYSERSDCGRMGMRWHKSPWRRIRNSSNTGRRGGQRNSTRDANADVGISGGEPKLDQSFFHYLGRTDNFIRTGEATCEALISFDNINAPTNYKRDLTG